MLFPQLKLSRNKLSGTLSIDARKCEDTFRIINKNAVSIGIKINAQKTQLLSISDSNYSTTKTYIYTEDGERIDSTGEMKILGFIFGVIL